MTTLRAWNLGSVCLILLASVTCAHQKPQSPTPGPPVGFTAPSAADLPPPDDVPGLFTVRQRLVAKSPHGGGSFEAVLAKNYGRLTIVGLMPYGARAFVLEQTRTDVKFTNHMPREPPFPPAWILLDVHRVFGTWLGPPIAAGRREGTKLGEHIVEVWRDGRLAERTFTRANPTPGPPTGSITITYQGEARPGIAERVVVRNERFQYDLSIQTLP